MKTRLLQGFLLLTSVALLMSCVLSGCKDKKAEQSVKPGFSDDTAIKAEDIFGSDSSSDETESTEITGQPGSNKNDGQTGTSGTASEPLDFNRHDIWTTPVGGE